MPWRDQFKGYHCYVVFRWFNGLFDRVFCLLFLSIFTYQFIFITSPCFSLHYTCILFVNTATELQGSLYMSLTITTYLFFSEFSWRLFDTNFFIAFIVSCFSYHTICCITSNIEFIEFIQVLWNTRTVIATSAKAIGIVYKTTKT